MLYGQTCLKINCLSLSLKHQVVNQTQSLQSCGAHESPVRLRDMDTIQKANYAT